MSNLPFKDIFGKINLKNHFVFLRNINYVAMVHDFWDVSFLFFFSFEQWKHTACSATGASNVQWNSKNKVSQVQLNSENKAFPT